MMSRIFERTLEIIGWLQLVASPVLFAVFVSGVIFLPNPTMTRLLICIAILSIALIIGIWYATRIYKSKGTMSFLSQIRETPESNNNSKKDD